MQQSFWRRIRPVHLFGLAVGYLLVMILLTILIDFMNVFNVQKVMKQAMAGASSQLFWYQIFKEAGLTELLQWFYLTGCVILCGMSLGRLKEMGSQQTWRFFLYFSIGMSLMLMEDAGNIRHSLKEYFHVFFGDTTATNVTVEMSFYSLIGLMMVMAVIRYGRYLFHSRLTMKYMAVGFVAYATASIASATRDIGYWYFRVGAHIHEVWLGGMFYDRSTYYVNFLIMDTILEESIELIGAAALCAALLAFYHWLDNPEHRPLLDFKGPWFRGTLKSHEPEVKVKHHPDR